MFLLNLVYQFLASRQRELDPETVVDEELTHGDPDHHEQRLTIRGDNQHGDNGPGEGGHDPSTRHPFVSPKPSWYQKLKSFFNTPTSPSELESYVPNYRTTPIISGIIIPFSILLEIPGLTGHWYIRTVDNQTIEIKNNPVLLDVGLGFSMACALLANICLVMRFLEKRIKLMTLFCVAFLTIHGTSVHHAFDFGNPQFTL